jgi:hypothetical protein
MWRIHARRDWSRDDWRAALSRSEREVEARLDQLVDDPERRYWAYCTLRDGMEAVEFHTVGLAAAEGVDVFDPAAILRRLDHHRTRLARFEGSADRRDRARIQGQRKIVRKWLEHQVLADHRRQMDLLRDLGQDPTPVYDAFRSWIARPDRRAFDGPVHVDAEVRALFGPSAASALG